MDFDNLIADTEDILTVHFSGGRDGHTLDKVIVHYNDGNLTVEDCYRVWQSREASAHYQVEESGRIGQLVYDANTSWNCGKWVPNCESIGIEHANRSDGTISDACLDAGAHLVAAICKKYDLGRPEWLTNVFPHCYFVSTSCPGEIYGSQKDAYIARAQDWYDKMTGAAPAPTTNDITEDDDMQFICNYNGQGQMVWYDGSRLHWLDEPDTMTSVQMAYKAATGRDIPVFDFGSADAPWASRFAEAVYDGSDELSKFEADHK
jgi:hypothetical protein